MAAPLLVPAAAGVAVPAARYATEMRSGIQQAKSSGIPGWVWALIILVPLGAIAWLLFPVFGAAGGVLGAAADIVEGTIDGIKDLAKEAKALAKEIWQGFKDFLSWLKDKFKAVWDAVSSFLSTAANALKSAATWVWKHTLGAIF